MPTRSDLAGPPLPTPEAQCQGAHTFELALAPHAGDWRAIYREAYTFHAPIYLRRGTEQEGHVPTEADLATWGSDGWVPIDLSGDLPSELSFLSLEPGELALSAIKRAEAGDQLIVRFYNPTGEHLEARLRTFLPIVEAEETNLNEERTGELTPLEESAVHLSVPGHAVKTVALRLA
jgi:alpha-mannosidase